MSRAAAIEDLKAKVGTQTHVGQWKTITQDMLNQFADVTNDHQWIHTDPERAKKGPFGSTIAHGFLTLSLITSLTDSANPDRPTYPGVTMGINYGLNRVRFPAPVPVGVRVRSRTTLLGYEEVKGGGIQLIRQVAIEIEGQEKPACVAETVTRIYF